MAERDLIDLRVGDNRELLRALPDACVQTVVTSPPYWGLRDYGLPPSVWGGDPGCVHAWTTVVRPGQTGGTASPKVQTKGKDNFQAFGPSSSDSCACGAWRGCLGLEPTPDAYVEHLVDLFREVRRVLRRDGTVWLNLGDCYAANRTYQVPDSNQVPDSKWCDVGNARGATVPAGLKPKDLVGIPWRVAFALQADGWWLRSDIVWSKPNCMPESITDRPTRSHEYLFLLSKSASYFYDHDAVKEPSLTEWDSAKGFSSTGKRGEAGDSFFTGEGTHHLGPQVGRNKRTVWTITTQPTPEAHFATFPEALVEPCIKAGTSAKGACATCGAPWTRVVETDRSFESGSGRSGNLPVGKNGAGLQGGGETLDVRCGPTISTVTTGWKPGCTCDADVVPCLVLDPFGGSGTTGRVAYRFGRRCVIMELNPAYVDIADRRLTNVQGELLA